MSLEARLDRVISLIQRGQISSEAEVIVGVISPILRELGWDIDDPSVVRPEFRVESLSVGRALFTEPQRPKVFIEAKAFGFLADSRVATEAEHQLFRYCGFHSVPLAVLTDGQEWRVYLPKEEGKIADRRVQLIDLLERDVSEIGEALDRYLSFDKVRDGEAERNAFADLKSNVRTLAVARVLPEAWVELLLTPDDELVQLLASTVEEKCGFQPEIDQVGEFLSAQCDSTRPVAQFKLDTAPPATPRRQTSELMNAVAPVPSIQSTRTSDSSSSPRERTALTVEVLGKSFTTKFANQAVIFVLEELAKRDPSFLDRFATRKHGKKRKWLARSRSDLYPGREDLAEEASTQIADGWWFGTNYSVAGFLRHIRLASEVSGLTFGADIKVEGFE